MYKEDKTEVLVTAAVSSGFDASVSLSIPDIYDNVIRVYEPDDIHYTRGDMMS
jgi:hypothetical protein